MFRINEVDGGEINILNVAGTQVNPATEDTLNAIKDTDGIKKIVDALPTGSNTVGKVFITDGANDADLVVNNSIYRLESRSSITSPDGVTDADVGTLATANNRISVSSRLTDGVGWIGSIVANAIRRIEGRFSLTSPDGVTDADVGTSATSNNRLSTATRLTDGIGWLSTILNNSIRRLEGRSSITAPDGALDVAVTADNSINRLEVRASVVGQTAGTGSEKKVSVINDTVDSNVKRLQTQALLAPGSVVNIGTSIPADPANLIIDFLKKTGGSEDMLVNGSVTPVEFSYQPGAGVTIAIDSVLLVFTTDNMYFDGLSFGPNSALTNGIKLELTLNSSPVEIFNITRNEDFLRVPGRVPVINNTGPKDLVAIAFSFGGLIRLAGSASDRICMIVRDNLTSVKFKHLSSTLYGAEV